MTRRRALALAAVAAALALCGVVAPPAPAAKAHCSPAGAKIKAQDARAQIYALKGGVYGCDAKTGLRTKLGNTTLCINAEQVQRLAPAGDVVAYGLEFCGIDAGSTVVHVLRLGDGKKLASYSAATGNLRPESYETVDSVVVKRGGRVAWIVRVTSVVPGGDETQVLRRGKLLDSGPAVDPFSLRLHGSTLTWRHGDVTRSATL